MMAYAEHILLHDSVHNLVETISNELATLHQWYLIVSEWYIPFGKNLNDFQLSHKCMEYFIYYKIAYKSAVEYQYRAY